MKRLSELAASGALHPRDIDVIMVATGALSRQVVARYLAKGTLAQESLPDVAREITHRICGCQYHDGGSTELVSVDPDEVRLRVAGACVRCPQIVYTIDVLRRAISSRAPAAAVHIDGTDFSNGAHKPADAQLTMAMLMRRTGLTFEDLDRELDRKEVLTDDDLIRLARRCALRSMVADDDTPPR